MSVRGFRVGEQIECERCSNPIPDFKTRSRTCVSCGHTYRRLCSTCSTLPCTDNGCGGVLKDTDEVFPHSLFNAIQAGSQDRVIQLLREHPTNLERMQPAARRIAAANRRMCPALSAPSQ